LTACIDFEPADLGLKDIDCVKSATVMEDGSIVIVVPAKDSPIAAVNIIRFDVVRSADGGKELKPREDI
jgi:hypothetical protein